MFDLDLEFTRGFRVGLWYFDFSTWEDVDWNLAVCLDLGICSLRLWLDLKEGRDEEEPELPY